jgi:hypothetical protein
MIGCGCLLVVVLVVGAGLLFVPKLARDVVGAISAAKSERDRLYAEALANGDAAIAYERADERFRQAYTEEQLAAYFKNQPALFDPPQSSVSLRTQTTNGKTVVSTTFEAGQRKYAIYAAKRDRLRLLGISPALDQAVPPENRGAEP